MRYGYDMATAARTTVNVMAVDAFRRVAELGAALGRPAAEVAAAAVPGHDADRGDQRCA